MQTIELGTASVPEDVLAVLKMRKLNDVQVKQYMFSHEVMHHVIVDAESGKESRRLKNLHSVITRMRKHSGLGLSRLGSMPFYRQMDEVLAAQEDVRALVRACADVMTDTQLRYICCEIASWRVENTA